MTSPHYVEIDLDGRRRRLLFRIVDLRDLCRRLGTRDVPLSMMGLLTRLGEMDLDAMGNALWYGLRHEDRALKPTDMDDAVQTFIDKGGSLPDLLASINEAIEKSGVLRKPETRGDAGNAGTDDYATAR